MISVIIPAYNAALSIGRCLSALKRQSYPADEYEVIVVDDGSSDETATVAEQYAVTVIRSSHQGPAATRNLGVAKATGDVILFTDADCEPEEHWLEAMTRPFRENAQIAGVKGVYRTRQRSLVARFAQIEFEDRYRKLAKSQWIDFVDSHAAAFRREVFLQVGGFDPNFPVANNEDVELSYKIAHAGYRMVFNPQAIVYHLHPESWTAYLKTKLLRAYWRMKVYQKFPHKMVTDSYTPQTLKLEIVFSGFLLAFLMLSLWRHVFLKPALASALLFMLCALPFFGFALKRDPMVALVSPLLVLARSVVFLLGVAGGTLSQKRRDILLPAMLVMADLVSCSFGLLVAYWIRASVFRSLLPKFDHPIEVYLASLLFIIVIWLGVFNSQGLYRAGRFRSPLTEYVKILQSVSQVILIIIALSFFLKMEFSRPMIILYWILGSLFALSCRGVVRHIQRPMIMKGYNAIRVGIIGSGEMALMVAQRLQSMPDSGYRLVGYLDRVPNGRMQEHSISYLGSLDDLVSIIDKERVDEVLIATPELSHQATFDLIARTDHTGVSFKVVSDVFDILSRGADMDAVVKLPVVNLREEGKFWLRNMLKAVMDYCLGGLLLIVLSPLMAIIALLIKTASHAAALRTLDMVGCKERLFRMYRFNCEPTAAGWYGKLSAFLERSHLDELPQLLNVWKGEMSLVGPRPELPAIVATYDEWQRRRLMVKPGITGLWQIYGPEGRPLHHDLELDFYYIKNYNLLLDLSILIKTIPIALLGRG